MADLHKIKTHTTSSAFSSNGPQHDDLGVHEVALVAKPWPPHYMDLSISKVSRENTKMYLYFLPDSFEERIPSNELNMTEYNDKKWKK